MTAGQRIALATGFTLNVVTAGERSNPSVILLHGFPESHRTWRGIRERLAERLFLIMPDQRGFGASDRPQGVEAYSTKALVDDVFALAEALEIDRFALVGHDWGGAVAWPAALRGDPRLTRLAVINAPHPLIFQTSLIEDTEQNAASQYINAFRAPGIEAMIAAKGYDWFFERSFSAHVDPALIPSEEKARYLADWSRPGALTTMLNWYRGSKLVVPGPGEHCALPDWVRNDFPKIAVPTLVIWGMRDPALLALQLDGLDEWVEDLTVVRLPNAGHFAPWETPAEVAAALLSFLAA